MYVTAIDGVKCGAGKYTSKKNIHTRIDPYLRDLQRVLEVYIHSGRALYSACTTFPKSSSFLPTFFLI